MRTKIITVTIEVSRTCMKKKKKSESAIRNSFTRYGMFCEKGLCFGCGVFIELLSSLSTTQTKHHHSNVQCQERCRAQGALEMWPGSAVAHSLCLSLHSPALHIPHSNSAVRNCTTFRISSFSTDSCHPLLPVPNESFGTKPVKTGKGYASGDVGKQVATFRELKLSFSCD